MLSAAATGDEVGEASVSPESIVVVALAPAEERAVLRIDGELWVARPGDEIPGFEQSEVRTIQSDRLIVRLDGFRQAWISPGDGPDRILLLDVRPPERPPIQEPLWLVPDDSHPETEPAGRAETGAADETTGGSR